MKKKTTGKKPWGIWLLLSTIIVIDVGLIFLAPDYLDPDTAVEGFIWLAVGLIFAFVASLILVRQPRHVIGWLLMVPPIMAAASGVLDLLFKDAVSQATELSIPQFIYLWFQEGWSWWLLIGPIFLIFLLFPTGHVLSPKWRWAVALIAVNFLFFVFIISFTLSIEIEAGLIWENPIGFLPQEVEGVLLGIMSVMLLANTVISFASIFIRYRQSQAVERAQIRWLFFSCIIFLVAYLPNFVAQFEDSFLLNILFMVSIIGIPVSIGAAILRYRLWDIDLVINRSLVYGVLTTLLAAIFAGTAALLTQIAKAIFDAEMQQAVAAVAAIFVASIFQPLRTWVENGINRRLFPENIDLGVGLIEINPDLWSWISLPKMLEATLNHLQDIYSYDAAAIYLKRNDEYILVAAHGLPRDSKKQYKPSTADNESLAHKRGIVHENEKPFIATIPVYLARRKAPDLLGVLRLGRRPQGRGYSGDDLKTLVSFGAKLGQPIYALTSTSK